MVSNQDKPEDKKRMPILFPGKSCYPLSKGYSDKPIDKRDQLRVILKLLGKQDTLDFGLARESLTHRGVLRLTSGFFERCQFGQFG